MKLIFLSLALISIQLTGMKTIDVASQSNNDDLYAIMEKIEQNKPKLYKGRSFNIAEKLHDKNIKDTTYFLLCKQYLPFYKKCIAGILPLDICKQIDNFCAQLKNKEINKAFIKKTGMTGDIDSRFPQPLKISNNGQFLTHDLAQRGHVPYTTLFDTKTGFFPTNGLSKPLCFSPNNKFCVTISKDQINYYKLQDNFSSYHSSAQTIDHCFNIIISDDSKYILAETRHAYQQSRPIYKMWTVDDQDMPQSIPLKDDLICSTAVIFHPDNQHIIHSNHQDELRLYNIETSEDKIISPATNKDVHWIEKLMLNSDHTTIIAKIAPIFRNFIGHRKYMLFNIENLDNVTAISIPEQSLDDNVAISELSELLQPQCIPHKRMITHITNCGHTLQLLDENMQCVASHHTKESVRVTALAIDTTGDYLAAGYSDGSIMIWNVSSAHPAGYDKIFMQTIDLVTSLTFNDNQQLLSQSQSGQLKRNDTVLCKFGSAILWDVYGNEIIDCGYQIVKSVMSSNGKTIVTLPLIDTLTEYRLQLAYDQIDDENLAQYSQKEITLTQLARLIFSSAHPECFCLQKCIEGQMHLDAQQLTHLPCNQ